MLKVIILAAGEGKRLHPYTQNIPKCLVEVSGKSILDYQLDVIRSQHIDQIVIVKGYLAHKFPTPRLIEYFNTDYANTNMVWTLFCAEKEMTDNVIVSYGDIVYSKDILSKLKGSMCDISVVVDKGWKSYWEARFENPLDDVETLRIGQDGRIIEIGQTPDSLQEIEGQYIGLMKFSTKGLSTIKKIFNKAKSTGMLGAQRVEKAYMTDLLQAVIDEGHDIWPVFTNDYWVEIDTVKDLNLNITKHRLDKISNL